MPKLLQTNSISIVNRRKHERIDLKRLPDTDDSWRAWKQKGKISSRVNEFCCKQIVVHLLAFFQTWGHF